MQTALYRALEGHMLKAMEDAAHDPEHIYRVLYLALDIANNLPGSIDTDVLIAACLLHDIGRGAQNSEPGLCHAQEGARLAAGMLDGLGCEPDFTRHVCDCIRTHRARRGDPPRSMEAKILFDADKLDVAGAMGAARTLLYEGRENIPLYRRGDDGRIRTEADGPESYFQEYSRKLRDIGGRLYTDHARRLAAERLPALEAFSGALLREADQGRAAGQRWLAEILGENAE